MRLFSMEKLTKWERFTWFFIATVLIGANSCILLWLATEQLFFSDGLLSLCEHFWKFAVMLCCSSLTTILLHIMKHNGLLTVSATYKLIICSFILPLLYYIVLWSIFSFFVVDYIHLLISYLAEILPFLFFLLFEHRRSAQKR